jgi:hypothetical protein
MEPEITQPNNQIPPEEAMDLTADDAAAALGFATTISEQMLPQGEEGDVQAQEETVDVDRVKEEVKKAVEEQIGPLKEQINAILSDEEPEQEEGTTTL